jgi:hypothetical protein
MSNPEALAGLGKRERPSDEESAAAARRPRLDGAVPRHLRVDDAVLVLEPTVLLDASLSGGGASLSGGGASLSGGGADVDSVITRGADTVWSPSETLTPEAASGAASSESRGGGGGGAGRPVALPSSLRLPDAWGPVAGPRAAIMIECDKMAAPCEGSSASADQIRPALVLLQLVTAMLKEIPDAGASSVLRKRIYDVVSAQRGHPESAFFKELTCSVHLGLVGEVDDAPVTLLCGHSFCRQCLAPLFASPSPTCPTCRDPIFLSLSALNVNLGIKGIVDHLRTEQEFLQAKAAASTMKAQPPLSPPLRPLGISLAGFKEIIARAGGRERLRGKTTDWVKTHWVLPSTFNDVSSGGGAGGAAAECFVSCDATCETQQFHKHPLAPVEHFHGCGVSVAEQLLALGRDFVAPANIFISHHYENLFLDIFDAFEAWATEKTRDAQTHYAYFDLFVNNQHAGKKSFDALSVDFGGGVRAIRNTLLCLVRPTMLTTPQLLQQLLTPSPPSLPPHNRILRICLRCAPRGVFLRSLRVSIATRRLRSSCRRAIMRSLQTRSRKTSAASARSYPTLMCAMPARTSHQTRCLSPTRSRTSCAASPLWTRA